MRHSAIVFVLCLNVLVCAERLWAADECPAPAREFSAEFNRIKALAGEWQGTSEDRGKQEPATVRYEITSGGTAVVETLFPGTPHEMVSVYHDEGGRLAMTHYCMLGNQPTLALTKSSFGALALELAPGDRLSHSPEAHMHSLQIAFHGPDRLTQRWTSEQNGKSMGTTVMNFRRK
ncbi:MAG: hypothetical protein K1X83_08240 [Oligoflexia bacterium]|nr:hypothetical protein [Oligoflexia bacterium]